MGNIGQLFSRELGLSINNARKIGKFKVPKKAVSYDKVTGTASRGDFEVLTFRNQKGKVIKMGQTFVDEAGNCTHIVRNYSRKNGSLRINESRYTNGQENSFISQILVVICSKSEVKNLFGFLKCEQKIINGKETHAQEWLRIGKPAQGVEYDCNWNGNPTKIRYKNINNKLDLTEQEFRYLPLKCADLSTKRINQKLDLIQLIQEKLYGIQGLVPKVKFSTFRELNPKQTQSSCTNIPPTRRSVRPMPMIVPAQSAWWSGEVRILDSYKKKIQMF